MFPICLFGELLHSLECCSVVLDHLNRNCRIWFSFVSSAFALESIGRRILFVSLGKLVVAEIVHALASHEVMLLYYNRIHSSNLELWSLNSLQFIQFFRVDEFMKLLDYADLFFGLMKNHLGSSQYFHEIWWWFCLTFQVALYTSNFHWQVLELAGNAIRDNKSSIVLRRLLAGTARSWPTLEWCEHCKWWSVAEYRSKPLA